MPARRLLALSADNEPLWVRLYVDEIEGVWAAMIAGTPGAGRGRPRADAPGARYGSARGRAERTARGGGGL
jgi:hypothetical protein